MSRLGAVWRELFGWTIYVLFWLRELAGWGLLVLGLLVFYMCFAFLVGTPPRIIQVLPLTFLGFILFRTGIQLLRVSAAALVCLRAQDQLNQAETGPGLRHSGPAPRTRIRTGPFELGSRSRP